MHGTLIWSSQAKQDVTWTWRQSNVSLRGMGVSYVL